MLEKVPWGPTRSLGKVPLVSAREQLCPIPWAERNRLCLSFSAERRVTNDPAVYFFLYVIPVFFPTLWVTTTTLRWSVFFGVTWSNKSLFQKTYACYLQTSQRFQNCENAFLRYSFEPVKEEDTVSQQEPDSIRLHPKNNGKQVCVCVFNRFLLSRILNSIIG